MGGIDGEGYQERIRNGEWEMRMGLMLRPGAHMAHTTLSKQTNDFLLDGN
jgi:hypothetical protein